MPAPPPRASKRCGRSSSDTDGLERGEEDALRAERERLRHATELGRGRRRGRRPLAPEDGDGAASLAAAAERALIAPLDALAPELAAPASELRELAVAAERGRQRPAPVRRLAGRRPGAGSRWSRPGSTRSPSCGGGSTCQSLDELLDRARGRCGRARRARRRARSRCGRGGRAREAARSEYDAARRGAREATRGEPPSRSPPRSPRICGGSAWVRASSRSSCVSASRGRPAGTRSRS